MDYAFTEQQAQLRDSIARFCREQSSSAAIRSLLDGDTDLDPELWKRVCNDLGLVALHVPESRSGLGFGPVELGIVMEEFGRSLLPVPYLSSVLASSALAAVASVPPADELIGAIASGTAMATLILDPAHGHPLCRGVTLRDGRLHGVAHAVLDGMAADEFLLVAGTPGSASLLRVSAAASGLTRTPLRTMDATRPLARVSFDGCEFEHLGTLDPEPVYDTALVALANEMVGSAQALLHGTVAYTRMRVQFGRPIGSFQAIKHRLADLLTDVELARTAAYQAAQALAAGGEVSAHASMAKFVASDACMNAAREAIQLRGGIGFTWEDDTHLWYRRAKSSEVFLGTPAWHRERMIQRKIA